MLPGPRRLGLSPLFPGFFSHLFSLLPCIDTNGAGGGFPMVFPGAILHTPTHRRSLGLPTDGVNLAIPTGGVDLVIPTGSVDPVIPIGGGPCGSTFAPPPPYLRPTEGEAGRSLRLRPPPPLPPVMAAAGGPASGGTAALSVHTTATGGAAASPDPCAQRHSVVGQPDPRVR